MPLTFSLIDPLFVTCISLLLRLLLYGYTAVDLSILVLMNIWVVSMFRFFAIANSVVSFGAQMCICAGYIPRVCTGS